MTESFQNRRRIISVFILNKFDSNTNTQDNIFTSRNIGAVHILYLRGESQRIQRNGNASKLEKFWSTYFYGPLWVAFSTDTHPPVLVSCTPKDIDSLSSVRTAEQKPENKLVRWLMEMEEFNRNLDEYQAKLSTFEFAMFRYKTSWCPKIGQKHDWAQWIYAHRLQDFRRPPDYYEYLPEDCTCLVHKDCSWESWRDGLYCKYSHTTFERLYHPHKFKLVPWEKKVCTRAEMCAFYHKPEEKVHVEKESDQFVDPLAEDYPEGEYDQDYGEGEYDSAENSPRSNESNTNTNTNFISQESAENDSAAKPEAKFSIHSSDQFGFEEGSEDNVWANEEFGLEVALKKTHSQIQKEDFEAISKDQSPKTSPIGLSPKKDDLVSFEIKNIVLGNDQQIETQNLVQNIVSQAPSTGKSKFFDFKEEAKEAEDDLINNIFSMDYNSYSSMYEQEETKPKTSASFHPYQELKSLYVIPEETEAVDSAYCQSNLTQNFVSQM